MIPDADKTNTTASEKRVSENTAAQILSVISFSATGAALARHLKACLPGMPVQLYGKYSGEAVNAAVWAGERMAAKDALLFIGASGICVRSIAPHIRNKLVDSPVLVMDELGKHIIPLLSGHVGGANELALRIADAIGADPVITTATDLHERFAVDVFAKKQHLRIVNKNGIAPVSSKVLRGEALTMAVQDGCISEGALRELPESVSLVPFERLHLPENPEKVDILVAEEDIPAKRTICLAPKPYVIGIGCRKGKEAEAVEEFVNRVLAEHHIAIGEVYAAASIDVKKDEEGILAFCRKYKLPYHVYSAEELLQAPGEYEESAFVKQTVGVGNVCERAAALTCVKRAEEIGAALADRDAENRFICRKQRGDGVTCAIARWR